MIAELLWILRGSNSVSEISHYNKNWANFSDDGVTLNGAYGRRIFKHPCVDNNGNLIRREFKKFKEFDKDYRQ